MQLREYLRQSGLPLSRFAETVGVTEASMSRYVSGKRVPRRAIMERIVAATEGAVQPNDFFLAAEGAEDEAVAEPDGAVYVLPEGTLALDVLFADLHGILRGKRLAPEGLQKLRAGGVVLPGSTFALDITGANVDATGTGMVDGDPDYVCRLVPGTLVPVPWAERPTYQALVSMYTFDGQPFRLDPRHVLARAAAPFADLGLKPVVAIELEFYLIDREPDAEGRPQPPISPLTGRRAHDTQVYGIDDLEAAAPVIDDITAACRAQRIPADVAIAEYAPGQYEINLHHQPDPVTACDHAVLLKRVIKGVARRHGLDATFMAKPYADLAGNGTHVHVSVLDETGANIFDERRAEGETRLRHAVGGLRASMAEAMLLFAPNANSFRRLQPGSYAPLAPSWGFNNRTVAVRIPAQGGLARRIEHRTAGADANPYLVTAAVLAGIHHGLVERLDPGPPIVGNAYEQEPQTLPSYWLDALRAFDAANVLPRYLGPDYCRVVSACKWHEMALFNRIVTPTEYDWYLRAV